MAIEQRRKRTERLAFYEESPARDSFSRYSTNGASPAGVACTRYYPFSVPPPQRHGQCSKLHSPPSGTASPPITTNHPMPPPSPPTLHNPLLSRPCKTLSHSHSSPSQSKPSKIGVILPQILRFRKYPKALSNPEQPDLHSHDSPP